MVALSTEGGSHFRTGSLYPSGPFYTSLFLSTLFACSAISLKQDGINSTTHFPILQVGKLKTRQCSHANFSIHCCSKEVVDQEQAGTKGTVEGQGHATSLPALLPTYSWAW